MVREDLIDDMTAAKMHRKNHIINLRRINEELAAVRARRSDASDEVVLVTSTDELHTRIADIETSRGSKKAKIQFLKGQVAGRLNGSRKMVYKSSGPNSIGMK